MKHSTSPTAMIKSCGSQFDLYLWAESLQTLTFDLGLSVIIVKKLCPRLKSKGSIIKKSKAERFQIDQTDQQQIRLTSLNLKDI